MNKNLTSINQNAKSVLSKSKSLLNVTNSLLSKKANNDLARNFQFKPYLMDTLNCLVKSVVITPDGKTIISGSADNAIKFWDFKSGEHIKTLDRQESIITLLSITPDGKSIIIANKERTIDLCDIKTGKSIKTFNNYYFDNHFICSLNVTSDGKYLLSHSCYSFFKGGYDNYDPIYDYGRLEIMNIETGEYINTIKSDTIAIAPNGEYFVSKVSYEDYETELIEHIALYSIKTGKIIDFLDGIVQNHSTNVGSLVITPDGNTIISGGGNDNETITLWDGIADADHIYTVSDGVGLIKLWDISGARYIKVLEGHTDSVYSLVVTPDGKNIVSGSADNTIKIWDIESGKCIRTLKSHTDAVNLVIITQDGKNIVSRSNDYTIKVWDIESGKCNYTIYNMNDGSNITMLSGGFFNASEDNIDKCIRIDDSSTTCRKLTKEEIEHFCKVKYENKSHIPEIEIDENEIPF